MQLRGFALAVNPAHDLHFVFVSDLNRNLCHTIDHLKIKGRCRQCDIERYTIVMGCQCFEVGADLVGTVTAAGNTVCPCDYHIHHAMLHEVTTDIISNDGMFDPCLRELPGSEVGTLVSWSGLIDPDMDINPSLLCLIDRCQCRTAVDDRQPACIAVGEEVEALQSFFCHDLLDNICPKRADLLCPLNIFIGDKDRLFLEQCHQRCT